MEIHLLRSYIALCKKPVSFGKFLNRCKQFQKRQKIKKVFDRHEYQWQGADLQVVNHIDRTAFKIVAGNILMHLELKELDLVRSESPQKAVVEHFSQPEAFIPRKLLMNLGATEDLMQAVNEVSTNRRKPISRGEFINIVTYEDMVILCHHQYSRIFIDYEEIGWNLTGLSNKNLSRISWFSKPTTNSPIATCYASSAETSDWSYEFNFTEAFVMDLQRLRRLIDHNLEMAIKAALSCSDIKAGGEKLWESLGRTSTQEAVPEELNPVLHHLPLDIPEYLAYFPSLLCLVRPNHRIRVLDCPPPNTTITHKYIANNSRQYKNCAFNRHLVAFEDRYLFGLGEISWDGYFTLACFDVREGTKDDVYRLNTKSFEKVSGQKRATDYELSVLQRPPRQRYIHVLVAGFQAGLLLFTYYEKRFGLSGVFTLPDGKKSSIPVSLCPSSCGKFCYAYTSSEIYRVVIKPDKLL